MAEQTMEQKQEIADRFEKAGQSLAGTFKKVEQDLSGKSKEPKPEPKPPEKPRGEDGKFVPEVKPPEKAPEKPKTDHIPALRDALAREASKRKAAEDAVSSLRGEMAEIKALLLKGNTTHKDISPEEAKKVDAEERWVRERMLPQFKPVIDAANLILMEREAKTKAEHEAAEAVSQFESFADILGVSPEKRQEAVSGILEGKYDGPSRDLTFLAALKAVSGPSPAESGAEAAAKEAAAKAEAEKKAATGIMGRSAPVSEPETNDFLRKIADTRANKDKRSEEALIAAELERRLYAKFQAGHTTTQE